MKKTVLLVPAAALALALCACSGGDSGAAKPGDPATAGAQPTAAGSAGQSAAPATPAPTTDVAQTQELRPAPPPPVESHGSAAGYSDCMSRARAAGSEDERALLRRTCARMKPR